MIIRMHKQKQNIRICEGEAKPDETERYNEEVVTHEPTGGGKVS